MKFASPVACAKRLARPLSAVCGCWRWSRARAVALIENDPYWVPGLRRYRLLTWGNAFPDRPVTL